MINRAKAVWQFITSPDYSRTVSILALLVVVLAIPLTVFIAQQQQEIRQRAEGERIYCGGDGQPGIGVPVGTCQPDANGCTATKFTRYVLTTDANGDGVIDPSDSSGDQRLCDYVCAEPKTCSGAPTATPPPAAALPPTGELSINPSSGGVGTEFTLRGRVTASSTDSSNPSYLITKVEIWVTERADSVKGTPDRAPATCPGAKSEIWCNIETKWVSSHDVPVEKKWTAPAPGDYLFIINGISSNGVWCTGNPLPPTRWADCSGSTGKTDMAEVIISAAQVNACGKTCTLANNGVINQPSQPSQCTEANKYFYVQTEGWPQGQCSTACLTCPANTKPADNQCGCVPVPTVTSVPTGVQICNRNCLKFTEGTGIKNEDQCSAFDQYIKENSYDDATKTCSFECLSIPDAGTINKRKGQNGCGYEQIRVPTTTAPPCIGCNGDGPGHEVPAPTTPPGVPAPTSPPAGALTKLLFDLILPGATKDKRIVAQIFTTAPTPTPTPTTTPDTTPTPTPTPTPLPNQIDQDLAGTAKRGPGGNHTGTVDVANTIASGTYDIKIKADKYLRKLIKDVQITQSTTTRISQITLVLGDINGDNKLDIQDYNILIDCFGTNTSQACGNNKDFADLDDNGRVEGVDYNLFLRSMAKGVLQGD